MPNHTPEEGWEERFDEFMLDEYGKWKVGRAEAKAFIRQTLKDQAITILEQVRGIRKIAEFDETTGMFKTVKNDAENHSFEDEVALSKVESLLTHLINQQ